MSRTKRSLPKMCLRSRIQYGTHEVISYWTYPWLRSPQTLNTIKMEMKASEELKEFGFPKNRVNVRGNPSSDSIPNAWDDYQIAANREIYKKRK